KVLFRGKEGKEFTYQPFAFAPRGPLLYISDAYGTIHVWNTLRGKAVAAWQWHDSRYEGGQPRFKVEPLALSPDGRLLAIPGAQVTKDKKWAAVIELWETATAKKRLPLVFDVAPATDLELELRPDSTRIVSLVFTPDGKQLAAATLNTIHLL